MRMRSVKNAIVAGGLAIFAAAPAPVLADTVAISGITGSWFAAIPVVGTVITNGNPTSTIFWGVPATTFGGSGYSFTAQAGTVSFTVNPPPNSSPALLGTFEHLNFPVFPPFLQSVELLISADIKVNSTDLGVHSFVFNFTHDETPNGGPPGGPFSGTCPFPTPGSPNGSGININGCADSVTVSSTQFQQTFLVNGVSYTLDLLGFSQNGGATITNQFLTIEDQNNIAGLYADVHTTVAQVPEPNSLALVGLAMLGVVGFLRRRSSKK
jgi:hypothetical protein